MCHFADLALCAPTSSLQPEPQIHIEPNGTPDVKSRFTRWLIQGVVVAVLSEVAICNGTYFLEQSHKPLLALLIPCARLFPIMYMLEQLNPTISQRGAPTRLQRLQRIAISSLQYTVAGLGALTIVPSSSVSSIGLAVGLAIFDELKPMTRPVACLHAVVDWLIGKGAIRIVGAWRIDQFIGCPTLYVPTSVLDFTDQLAQMTIIFRKKALELLAVEPASRWLTASYIQGCIVGPIVEEVVCRGIIQEFLLRRLPRMILNRCAPTRAWIVDSTPCRVGRIATSAVLFTLMHINPRSCNIGGLLSVFLGGLTTGFHTEASGDIWGSMQTHMAHNSLCALQNTVSQSLK